MRTCQMPLVNRKWKETSVNKRTRNDWITIILFASMYVGVAVGIVLVLFLRPVGFIVMGVTVGFIALMFWIMNLKLKTISQNHVK
jgi:uncharacterized membrane protein YoaK (UPF0700 family)